MSAARGLVAMVAAVAVYGGDLEQARRHFAEYKFGMFIHWGPYSLAGVEASWPIMRPDAERWGAITEAEYRKLPQRFNPVRFDPAAWVGLAKAAGQRYMVITSKHHDGFCMFDSAYTDYKITNTPYGKDILAELAAACRREGMPLGFYYSPPDMNHPGFRDTSRPAAENWSGEPTRPEWFLYLDYMEAQLRELLTRYGDVFVIWFDGLRGQQKYDGRRFETMIRELAPGTLINNRIGVPGDFSTPEQFLPRGIPTMSSAAELKGVDRKQAANPPSGRVPRPVEFRPWETCMTINRTWAYNPRDREFKPATQLIRTLVEVASKGGNFLLNVGPTPEGEIQPEFQERLRAIGEWLKVNGEAIYGSTYGPIQTLEFGKTTAKDGAVYLHVFDWPGAELTLPWPEENLRTLGLETGVRRVEALAGGPALPFRLAGGRLSIDARGVARDPHATVLAIRLR